MDAVLIVGCGYLGRRVASRWLAEGRRVFATTRSAARADELRAAGFEPVVCDVTEPSSLAGLRRRRITLPRTVASELAVHLADVGRGPGDFVFPAPEVGRSASRCSGAGCGGQRRRRRGWTDSGSTTCGTRRSRCGSRLGRIQKRCPLVRGTCR